MTKSRNPLFLPLLFIVLVLIISWSYTAYLAYHPKYLRYFNRVMLVPGIVALLFHLFRWKDWRNNLRTFVGRWDPKAYLFSILYPLLFLSLVVGAVYLLGLGTFVSQNMDKLTKVPTMSAILFALMVVSGEEIGWRGYLLPALEKEKGVVFATVVVGVVWAVWHAPAVFMMATFLKTGNPWVLTFIQMLAVFVFSFPFAYCFFKSRSIWPPVLFHLFWNHYNPILLGNIYLNKAGLLQGNILLINGEGVAGVVFGTLFVVWFVSRVRSGKLSFPA